MSDDAQHPGRAPAHASLIIAFTLGAIGCITPVALVINHVHLDYWLILGGAIGLIGLFFAMRSLRRNHLAGGAGGAVVSVVLNLITLLFALACAFSFAADHEQPARLRCAADMRDLGMTIMQYAAEHDGRYPPDLASLSLDPSLPSRCNYLYIAPLTQPQPDTILLYEPLHDHADGLNILFADLHVEFRSPTDAAALLALQNLKLVP